MISLKSVTKIFKTKTAVSGISFQAKEGEIIGFLGPNGAGKTTTMRLLLGYLTPTTGEVLIDSMNPLHKRINVLKNVGYLPENNPLYTEMKVIEYLRFIAQVKHIENMDQIKTIAKDVNLDDVMNVKIEELSRGYKQRVGLAAALLGSPKIIILDEPTSGLDPIEQDKIKDLIKKVAKKKTVIFSTHILSEVEDIATRLVIINKGQVIYDGDKPKEKGGVEVLFKKLIKDEEVALVKPKKTTKKVSKKKVLKQSS